MRRFSFAFVWPMYSARRAGRSERSYWRSSSVTVPLRASAALVALGILKLNCECEWPVGQISVTFFVTFRIRLDAGTSPAPIGEPVRRVNGGRVTYDLARDLRLRLKITSTESSPPSSIADFTAFSAAPF